MRNRSFGLVVVALIIVAFSSSPEPKQAVSSPTEPTPTSLPTDELVPTRLPPTITPAISLLEPGSPNIIFHNGTVLTMEEHQPEVEAIAIAGEAILGIGEDEEILALQVPGTQIVDLEGCLLLPGFVDSHTHVLHNSTQTGKSLEEAQALALRYGITSIGEMFTTPELLAEVRHFSEADKLRVRTNLYLLYNTNCGDVVGEWYLELENNPTSNNDDMLRTSGVKVFSDGGSCRGVALSFEVVEGEGFGDLFVTQDELTNVIKKAQAAGYQVATHAIGDRAIDVVLGAIEVALEGGQNRLHHRIEHNAVIRPEQLPRYGQIDVVPTIRGLYPTCDPFGPPLSVPYQTWEWRVTSLIEANPELHIAWHSDYPYHSIMPLDHLFGFVTRHDVGKLGQVCAPYDYMANDTISVEEALRIMTIEGAYALLREKEVGSLLPDKLADMIILSDDPRTVDLFDIKKIDVLMTMVGGQVEWCARGFEALCPIPIEEQ